MKPQSLIESRLQALNQALLHGDHTLNEIEQSKLKGAIDELEWVLGRGDG